MITPEIIARINELARKQKEGSLSPAEQEEQATLRRQYIDHVKAKAKESLDAQSGHQQGHRHGHGCGCGCGHKH